MKRFYYTLFFLFLSLSVFSQDSENYILTIRPRVGLSNIQIGSNLNTSSVDAFSDITIDYYDGLGRAVQHIQKGFSPLGKDLIRLRKYNAYGKERRKYLPYPHPSQVSGFRVNHTTGYSQAKDYYRTNYNDENCISEVDFEKSPLFRVSREGGFGQDWQVSGGHAIYYYEGTNNNSSGTVYNPRHFEWSDNGIYKRERFEEGLVLKETTDEDGNVSMVFLDKTDGRLMVERKRVSGNNLTTYYVYDKMGRLRAVLPPELAYYMENTGSKGKLFGKSESNYRKFAYEYSYDERGNCIEKLLPGLHLQPVYIIYDLMNRPVLTQDGELRQNNQWKYQKYDAFGRPTESGLYTTTETKDILKAAIEGQTYCYEDRTSSGTFYTNRSYPTSSKTVLVRHYYDDYDAVPELGFGVHFRMGMNPEEVEHSFNYDYRDGFSQRAASAKGQLTMSEVALLDGTNPRVTVFYYDEKGRLVQERSENRIGGYDYIFYELDFTGLVLKQRHEHYSDYGDLFQTHYYFYDGQGRLTRIEHGLDDNAILNTETIKTIAAYTYDELGNLKTKRLYPDNSNQVVNYAVNYDYHIRGGLKRISSAYFTETLFYGNEASRNNALLSSTGYKAAYNGNIATKITEGLKRSGNNRANTYQYNYKYDQADRLTGAVYYNSNGEKFSTTGMTYDRNGNMLTLSRQGITQKLSPVTTYNTGNVDDLTYVYDGNRLEKISDANTTSWLYDGIQTYLPLLNPVLENIYNNNGALSFSGDQGLSIENNILNLPKRIVDLDNNVVEIVYDAAGQKVSYIDHSNSSQSKIYHRGMIYKNGELTYMTLAEGYYDGNSYYATISDYLGSVRVVLKDNPTAFNLASEVMEINHYDPWGVEFGMSEDPFGVQDFKHQGKERMNLLGKNVHDHGARLAGDGRWWSMDPLMEIYYDQSPYVYCGNNPIKNADPDGRWIWNAISAGVDYGFQVYNNYQKTGKLGYNEFVGDVNFVRVGLSAIMPGQSLLKTAVIETAKAAIEFTPNEGVNVSMNSDVIKEAAIGTAINKGSSLVSNKISKASSDASVKMSSKNVAEANKQLKIAEREAVKNPNSIKKAENVSTAKNNLQLSRNHQVKTQMLNSTVGRVNEKGLSITTEALINKYRNEKYNY